jgi:hypothetical protein
MTTDGRYLKLSELREYAINNASTLSTVDDPVLTSAILRAEMEIDGETRTSYDQQTQTLVQSLAPFVDGNGWIHLFAVERGPVSSVATVQIRDMLSDHGWQTITWSADDIIMPTQLDPPRPDSWHVRIKPATGYPSRSTGDIFARWTYTGGYATVPPSLKALTVRLAWWIYKLREAPLAKVVTAELGLMTIPLSVPPDIRRDLHFWRPIYS